MSTDDRSVGESRMTARPQPPAKAAPARPLTPAEQYDALCRSPAFQAGLRDGRAAPPVDTAILRQVANMLRPGLAALEGLSEEAAS